MWWTESSLAGLVRRFEAVVLSVACDAGFSLSMSRYESLKIHPRLVAAEVDLLKCAIASPKTLEKLQDEVRYGRTNLETFPDFCSLHSRCPLVRLHRRIWLRSSVAQDRFSDLSLLHIENDLTEKYQKRRDSKRNIVASTVAGIQLYHEEICPKNISQLLEACMSNVLLTEPAMPLIMNLSVFCMQKSNSAY